MNNKRRFYTFPSSALPSAVLPVWLSDAPQSRSCGCLFWQLCAPAAREPTLSLQPSHASTQHVRCSHSSQDQGVPLTSTGAGWMAWNSVIIFLKTVAYHIYSITDFSKNIVCNLWLVLDQHAAELQRGWAELSMSNGNPTAPARLPSPPQHTLW